MDDIQIVHCACSPCSGQRGGKEISSDQKATFGLLFVLEGCEEVTVGRRVFNLEPGFALLWDSTEPIRFRLLSPIRKLTVFLEQERLLRSVPNARDRLIAPLDWRLGTGAVAGAHIKALSNEASHIAADHAATSSQLLMGLISSELTLPADGQISTMQQRVLERADRYIDANLDDTDLDPQMIATALGISIRRLHQLFSKRGTTVSRSILERRLEKCRKDLILEPGKSITEIAFDWGFNDAAHFSRSFRRCYGEAASAFRNRFPGK